VHISIMSAIANGPSAQSTVHEADLFIPHTKKEQSDTPTSTVSTAASVSLPEVEGFVLPEFLANMGNLFVGANSSGVTFPSSIIVTGPGVSADPPPQEKCIVGASSAGVVFPNPFAPASRPNAKAVQPDAEYLAASSAGVAFPSPLKRESARPNPLPLSAGLGGVSFPNPFKAATAPGVSVPFSPVKGGLVGCSSAGVTFPSPLATA